VTKKDDKRTFDRIEIPGASVIFRKRNKLGFFERFSKPMQLYNITKSGICFGSDKKFDMGEPVCIDIKIPGEQQLRLYGKIKWITKDYNNNDCLIGAQFSAFGEGRNYNSLKSLDRLRLLQKKYGQAEN
jgi:Tfp pilus assembly protein PilZ